MPRLETQKEIRSAKALPFCYLCGRLFVVGDEKNDDHCPASACFLKEDRDFPLILKTHKTCNSSHGVIDQKIGQLIGLKNRQVPSPRDQQLKFQEVRIGPRNAEAVAVSNLPIANAVWRWIRGFHSALYGSYIPEAAPHTLRTPFPATTLTSSGHVPEPLLPQHQMFVQLLKDNRAAGRLDRIQCNSGKLTYECVWIQSDKGPWMCVFALDLYQWKDLGDVSNFAARGCAGSYVLAEGLRPPLATAAATLSIAAPNLDPLDPFGS